MQSGVVYHKVKHSTIVKKIYTNLNHLFKFIKNNINKISKDYISVNTYPILKEFTSNVQYSPKLSFKIIYFVCFFAKIEKNIFLQAFASGTFVYIIFVEIIPHEFNEHSKNRISNTVCLMVGFAIMAALQALPNGEDEEK